MARRESFTERRRRLLTRQVAALERLEPKGSIGDLSSPLGLAYQAIAGAGLAHTLRAWRAVPPPDRAAAVTVAPRRYGVDPGREPARVPPPAVPVWTGGNRAPAAAAVASGSSSRELGATSGPVRRTPAGASSAYAVGLPARAEAPSGSGGALARGGPVGDGGAAGTQGAGRPRPAPAPAAADAPPAAPPRPSSGQPAPSAAGTGGEIRAGQGDGSGDAGPDFVHPNFEFYTFNLSTATIFFPSAYQYATLGGTTVLSAQLRMQPPNSGSYSYSFDWDTSGLTHAASTSTTDNLLSITWNNTNATAAVDTVTLRVYVNGAGPYSETYSFYVPTAADGGAGAAALMPEVIGPDARRPGATTIPTHNAEIEALTGAVRTAVALPTYNPNVAPLVLAYNSLAADSRPIFLVHHAHTASDPAVYSAYLVLDGQTYATYYYAVGFGASLDFLTYGTVAQFALQADATGLATGRYAYTVSLNGSPAGSGYATVVNDASSTLGAGWSILGMERVVTVNGGTGNQGAFLDVSAGDALWFTGVPGPSMTYTSPAGEYSTLKQEADNSFTRTLKDGTKKLYRSADGRLVATVDRNGLRTTYAYDGSGRLATIVSVPRTPLRRVLPTPALLCGPS
jgi:YD repeat-containing protein